MDAPVKIGPTVLLIKENIFNCILQLCDSFYIITVSCKDCLNARLGLTCKQRIIGLTVMTMAFAQHYTVTHAILR